MSDYLRTTRECAVGDLNPMLLASIRTHIEKHELGDIEASVLICCETTSTKQKKGLLSRKPEVFLTGMLLTTQWLVWATGKDKPLGVQSARLRNIQVHDYETSDMFHLVQDTGINISGLRTDSADVGSTFIGLGAEPAAHKFRAMLKEAVAAV